MAERVGAERRQVMISGPSSSAIPIEHQQRSQAVRLPSISALLADADRALPSPSLSRSPREAGETLGPQGHSLLQKASPDLRPRALLPSIRDLPLITEQKPVGPSRWPPSPPHFLLPRPNQPSNLPPASGTAESPRLQQAKFECDRLLEILHRLRRQNRSRGIYSAQGDAFPPSSVYDHGECGVVLEYIDGELSAIAAREGPEVAHQVAESYGLHVDSRGMPFAGPPGRQPGMMSPETPSSRHLHSSSHGDYPNGRSQVGEAPFYTRERTASTSASSTSIGKEGYASHAGRADNSSTAWPALMASDTPGQRLPHARDPTAADFDSAPYHARMPHGHFSGSRPPLMAAENGLVSVRPTSSASAGRRSKAKRRVTKREGEAPACLGCGRLATAEWRRGPTGPRTLCNACGLLFAKMSRLRRAEANDASDPTLEELRIAVGASSKGQGRSGTPMASVEDASTSASQMPMQASSSSRSGDSISRSNSSSPVRADTSLGPVMPHDRQPMYSSGPPHHRQPMRVASIDSLLHAKPRSEAPRPHSPPPARHHHYQHVAPHSHPSHYHPYQRSPRMDEGRAGYPRHHRRQPSQ
ncbi:unnamed protein product [Parajaminaea phylloscopi]